MAVDQDFVIILDGLYNVGQEKDACNNADEEVSFFVSIGFTSSASLFEMCDNFVHRLRTRWIEPECGDRYDDKQIKVDRFSLQNKRMVL